MSAEPSMLIALWGAGLSTLLAIVKFLELWRERFRLDVSYNLTGSIDIGNTILIRNLSSRPIILDHWELSYCSRWLHRKCEDIAYADFNATDRRIEPHSTFKLQFSGQDHFSWGSERLKGRRIYIRLFIAGRKSVLKPVYPK
jgi:hypothetical protein